MVDSAKAVAAVDLSCGAPHVRAGEPDAGTSATLHALRNGGVPDGRGSGLPFTDVQRCGHAQLTTMQITRPNPRELHQTGGFAQVAW